MIEGVAIGIFIGFALAKSSLDIWQTIIIILVLGAVFYGGVFGQRRGLFR